jgi:hypothetical protein
LYGIKTLTILHNTFGAVKRNADFQPIDKDGNAIPGLYAGGELTGITLQAPATSRDVFGGGTGVGGFSNQGRIIVETMISKLSPIDTELAPYVFEGNPEDYDIQIYDAGDFERYDPVFLQ